VLLLCGVSAALCAAARPTPEELRALTNEDLLAAFQNWTPGGYDIPNPYEAEILARGEPMVEFLVRRFDTGQPLPSEFIWLFGQFGSPRAFPLLVKDYVANPNFRTAISIGACLPDEGAPAALRAALPDDAALKGLLQPIYGSRWAPVSALEVEALLEDLTRHLDEIRQDCRKRSIPQLG
jgi:hypothetical protein